VIAKKPEDEGHARAELRLIRRAVLNKWPMTPEMRARAVERVGESIDDPDSRVAIRAVEALVAMNAQNVTIDMAEERSDRLDAGEPTERAESNTRVFIIPPPVHARSSINAPQPPPSLP